MWTVARWYETFESHWDRVVAMVGEEVGRVWRLYLVGGALAFMSVVFGWWLLYFSAPVILFGLFGWVFEYYRGEDQNQ